MKSTDGFRLVRKSSFLDSIFDYYDYNSRILDLNTEYADNFNRQIFSIYNKLIEPDNLMETAKMIEKNKDMMIELFNLFSQLNVSLRDYYMPHLGIELGKASRLMEQIKQQYKIRDTKKRRLRSYFRKEIARPY